MVLVTLQQRIATKEQVADTDLVNSAGFHLTEEAVAQVSRELSHFPRRAFDVYDYSSYFDNYLKQFIERYYPQPESPAPPANGPSIRQLRQQMASNTRSLAKTLVSKRSGVRK